MNGQEEKGKFQVPVETAGAETGVAMERMWWKEKRPWRQDDQPSLFARG